MQSSNHSILLFGIYKKLICINSYWNVVWMFKQDYPVCCKISRESLVSVLDEKNIKFIPPKRLYTMYYSESYTNTYPEQCQLHVCITCNLKSYVQYAKWTSFTIVKTACRGKKAFVQVGHNEKTVTCSTCLFSFS